MPCEIIGCDGSLQVQRDRQAAHWRAKQHSGTSRGKNMSRADNHRSSGLDLRSSDAESGIVDANKKGANRFARSTPGTQKAVG